MPEKLGDGKTRHYLPPGFTDQENTWAVGLLCKPGRSYALFIFERQLLTYWKISYSRVESASRWQKPTVFLVLFSYSPWQLSTLCTNNKSRISWFFSVSLYLYFLYYSYFFKSNAGRRLSRPIEFPIELIIFFMEYFLVYYPYIYTVSLFVIDIARIYLSSFT